MGFYFTGLFKKIPNHLISGFFESYPIIYQFCFRFIRFNLRIFLVLLSVFISPRGLYSQNVSTQTRFEIAYDYYRVDDFASALRVFGDENIRSKDDYAASLVIKGAVFTDSISYEEGMKYHEQAYWLLRNSKNVAIRCKNYFCIGDGYLLHGEYDKSILCFQAMDLEASREGLIPEQRQANYYLAMNYQQLGKIPVSNTYIKKAIHFAKILQDSSSVFYCDYVLATNFNYYMVYDSTATNIFDSVMTIAQDAERYVVNEDPEQLSTVHDLYSKAYEFKRDFEKMKKHALLSLNYFSMTNDSTGIDEACLGVAQAYINLENFDSALYYQAMVDESRLANYAGGANAPSVYYHNLYIIYRSLDQPELALEYLEKYFELESRRENINNLDILQLRENFEAQKTVQFISAEKAKSEALFKQKRNFQLYITLAAVAVLIFVGYFFYYRYRSKKERQARDLQLLYQNAELSALKAQMNPHFIFNALNSIQHSIITNKNEEATRFLSKFSKLMRTVLDDSSEHLIPLNKEVETLSLYLDIESKRFDNSFSFKINLTDPSNCADRTMIPPMILQPYLENAIWHGLMPKEGSKELRINVEVQSEGHLSIEIIDNGVGRQTAAEIAATRNKSHVSKGMLNISGRIKLLAETTGIDVNIEIIDLKDENGAALGTKIVVVINRKQNR